MIRTLRIQLTDECNLRCVYCCNEGTKNNYSIIKNTNLVRFIHACYDVLGIKRIKFTGGEPLEYDENIADIIKNVNRENIFYSIVTNATNFSAFENLLTVCPNIEVTISLPVPPDKDYIQLYKKITGAQDAQRTFLNLIESINYMRQSQKVFKINYVLCNGINTSSELIGKMLKFSNENPNIRLRFLETAVNNTNNIHNRMEKYVFTVNDFESVLKQLGYGTSIDNKINDTRSSTEYDIENNRIKLIKFFCNNSCSECPQDKTSLWLTSTGTIKKCSYLTDNSPIKDWQYDKIAKQLQNEILSDKKY